MTNEKWKMENDKFLARAGRDLPLVIFHFSFVIERK
jgi:hypothetical protein